MGDFVVQECCVHGTDLESHGPTSILCDDPLPLLTNSHHLRGDIIALAMGSRSLMMTDVEIPKVTKVLHCISVE